VWANEAKERIDVHHIAREAVEPVDYTDIHLAGQDYGARLLKRVPLFISAACRIPADPGELPLLQPSVIAGALYNHNFRLNAAPEG
jgi:hypothetical protein